MKQIRVLNEISTEVSENSHEAWKEMCERFNEQSSSWNVTEVQEPYKAIVEYDNNQFKQLILPLYDDMLSTFTKNYGLAEETTKKYYSGFCRFVEIWHRVQAESLHRDVLLKLNLKETPLQEFYEDLEKQLQLLTSILFRKDGHSKKQ